MVVFFLGAVG